MGRGESEKRVADAIDVLDTVRTEWLRRPGVHMIDVGMLSSARGSTSQIGIRVWIDPGSAPEAGLSFPSELRGVRVEVREASPNVPE